MWSMGVYVDIDLDFLVSPVRQKSINNFRIYKYDLCSLIDSNNFVSKLSNKGLLNTKEKKFFTNHRKSYTYWWIKKKRDMTLIHIDAHSDLYRNKNRNLTTLRDTDMGCDDYIWYAIRDGYISRLFWVIPDNLYDLSNATIAEKFISKDMLKEYKFEDNILKIKFQVITRFGRKDLDYWILGIDDLPPIDCCDMLTLATSPEFIPQSADEGIKNTLELLGASEEDVTRIMKIHTEMPEYHGDTPAGF